MHALSMVMLAQVIQPLREHCENDMMEVVMVPSTRDVHHDAVFPQSPFRHAGVLCSARILDCESP